MGFVAKNKVIDVQYKKTTTHREYLNIKLKGAPASKVLVIMKNPSTTDKRQAPPPKQSP